MNVLLALAHGIHPHHDVALSFFSEMDIAASGSFFYLCRFTQLGLLRLLTNRSAMGADVLTQADAWAAYDRFSEFWNGTLLEEPPGIDKEFRRRTSRDEVSPKVWADGYLAAFAAAGAMQLVTFDRGLSLRSKGSVLLRTAS
ncbi:TA system VapC family ribonuclease toxin [Tunturibacter empetritectus]|uniref:TA system VapC family ribonuclease toxin n=1 Tax=Tunturiibacter empetritectus TaxID=3069691 RepID=UPI00162303BD